MIRRYGRKDNFLLGRGGVGFSGGAGQGTFPRHTAFEHKSERNTSFSGMTTPHDFMLSSCIYVKALLLEEGGIENSQRFFK